MKNDAWKTWAFHFRNGPLVRVRFQGSNISFEQNWPLSHTSFQKNTQFLKVPFPKKITLLVVSTHLKNISQNGNFPQIGVKIKNIWNHHLVTHRIHVIASLNQCCPMFLSDRSVARLFAILSQKPSNEALLLHGFHGVCCLYGLHSLHGLHC